MDNKQLLKQTSVLATYYKFVKQSRSEDDHAALYVAARNFNDRQRELILHVAETDDGIKPQPVGPSGATQLMYVLYRYIKKNHPGEWEKIK